MPITLAMGLLLDAVRAPSAMPAGPKRRRGAWRGAEASGLFAVAVVLPVALAVHYRSLGVPGSDDWAYDLAVYRLALHGHLYLYHWARVTVVGQILLGVPAVWLFGPHAWVLDLETSLLGWGGLVSVGYLGRRMGLTRPTAFFAACCVGLGPMWTPLSTSFMADVPAVSIMAMAAAVAAGDPVPDRLLTRRSAAALALAAFAFTIRDPAAVVFVAIFLARLSSHRHAGWVRIRPWLIYAGALIAALAAFYVWRQALPSGGGAGYQVPSSLVSWWDGEWFFPLLGLIAAPVLAAANPVAVVKAAWRRSRPVTVGLWLLMPIGPMLASVIGAARTVSGPEPLGMRLADLTPMFGDSYFSFDGYSPLGGRPFLPWWFTLVLGVASAAALAVLEALLVASLPRILSAWRTPADQDRTALLAGLTAAGSAAALAVLVVAGLVTWDRYMLPVEVFTVPLIPYLAHAAGVTDGATAPRGRWSAAPGLAGLAGLTVVASISFMAASGVDGFVGSEWAYADAFAASVRPLPPGLISAAWVWTSTQNRRMTDYDTIYNLEPGYRPCYLQVNAIPGQPGVLDVRREGSWVEPYEWGMEPNPAAVGDPACRTGPA